MKWREFDTGEGDAVAHLLTRFIFRKGRRAPYGQAILDCAIARTARKNRTDAV